MVNNVKTLLVAPVLLPSYPDVRDAAKCPFFFLNIELNSHADRDQASDCQIFPKLQFEVDATAHQSGAKSARHRQEVN